MNVWYQFSPELLFELFREGSEHPRHYMKVREGFPDDATFVAATSQDGIVCIGIETDTVGPNVRTIRVEETNDQGA